MDIRLSKHLTTSSALTLSHSSKLDDVRLTEHFKLSEFTKSSTAQKRGIDNTPSLQAVVNLAGLCHNVLEPLREHFNVPIVIGSGYRCPKLNSAVGGVSNSQHMKGEAADIHLPDLATGKRWFEYLKTLPHDQLIWERDSPTSSHYWIHVSCLVDISKNRNQTIPLLTKNQ